MSPAATKYLTALNKLHKLYDCGSGNSIEYNLLLEEMDNLWYALSKDDMIEVEDAMLKNLNESKK